MFSLIRKYLLNVLVSLDQFGNTITGGDPDETLSSRAAKRLHVWYWGYLGAALEWADPGHMEDSLEPDEGKDAIFKFYDPTKTMTTTTQQARDYE